MRLRRRIMYDILNTPGKRLAAGILSVLCSICLVLLVVFFSTGSKNDVKPAAAEQTASPSATAGPTPTVTAEPDPKPNEEQKVSDDQVSDDRAKPLPAPLQNSPQRAGAEAPPMVKPQIPPKPVGLTLPPIGGVAGKAIPAGQYVVFSDSGFVSISSDYRVWRYIYLEGNGRTTVFSISNGEAIKFQGTAYTPEQVAILDQYYGGQG